MAPKTARRYWTAIFGQTIRLAVAGLVLDGDEDRAFGGSRPLAEQDEPGDFYTPAIRQIFQVRRRGPALARQAAAHERHRMIAKRKPERRVIFRDRLSSPQRGKFDVIVRAVDSARCLTPKQSQG